MRILAALLICIVPTFAVFDAIYLSMEGFEKGFYGFDEGEQALNRFIKHNLPNRLK